MNEFINEENIANLAVKSLLYEVSISPKVGLVSRLSNGSHKDMNFYTFIDSAISLRKYFKNCFEYSKKKNIAIDSEYKNFFKGLRELGKKAEKDMFFATAGVNTHKGTIFSMGIFIAVFSLNFNSLKRKKIKTKLDKIFFENLVETIKKVTCCLEKELEEEQEEVNITAGEKIFRKYGIKGARGLALSGYELVLLDGVEKLKESSKKLDFETSCIFLLIYYVSVLNDTNIISRADKQILDIVKERAKKIFLENKINTDEKKLRTDVEELNKFFIEKNISAGGSADLLILSIFVYFLTRN